MPTTSPEQRTPQEDWRNGWWAHARACPSPNFGPRPADAAMDLVVVHSISLPPGEYGGDGIERLFTNTLDWDAHPYYQHIRGLEVSAHFVIRRDGSCLQFVSVLDRAWHAGRSSWLGRDNCNDHSIGIELEGLEGSLFEAPQYATLTRLITALASHWPVAHIAGHEHVAPGRKNDPGEGFDWAHLATTLGPCWHPATALPGPLSRTSPMETSTCACTSEVPPETRD